MEEKREKQILEALLDALDDLQARQELELELTRACTVTEGCVTYRAGTLPAMALQAQGNGPTDDAAVVMVCVGRHASRKVGVAWRGLLLACFGGLERWGTGNVFRCGDLKVALCCTAGTPVAYVLDAPFAAIQRLTLALIDTRICAGPKAKPCGSGMGSFSLRRRYTDISGHGLTPCAVSAERSSS